MTEAILVAALSLKTGLYNLKLSEISAHYGSFLELYNSWKRSVSIPEKLSSMINQAWNDSSLDVVKRALYNSRISAIAHSDSDYPSQLQPFEDKPYVIYSQGNINSLNSPISLSCVGTRRISIYGKRVVHALLTPLKHYPECTIVSGLAFGVDAESHRIALMNGLRTVAVLAGGLDRHEPLTNRHLAQDILKNDGCIVSEYPPGVRPQKHYFLERNRIIAGVSQATLIIEGTHKSGSLVTGKYALGYGKDVGAVPGDIFSPLSAGPHQLIRDGAWPILEFSDLQAMLRLQGTDLQTSVEINDPIYQVLKKQKLTIENLCEELHLDVQTITKQLTNLELDGLIKCTTSGEWYLLPQ